MKLRFRTPQWSIHEDSYANQHGRRIMRTQVYIPFAWGPYLLSFRPKLMDMSVVVKQHTGVN